MKFEKARLADHTLVENIRHVAIENTTAGFDILSFNSVKDLNPNRKIEVKSWAENKYFFFLQMSSLLLRKRKRIIFSI